MVLRTDAETLLAVGIVLASGAFVAYLGYRIRYHRDVHLVAGYDADRVTDAAGLADFAGGILLALGAAHVPVGLALLVSSAGSRFWTAYTLLVLAGVGVLVVGSRRYAE
jgi:hypothetical protein